MVRTVPSPRCCATSSTRRLPPLSHSSALRIAGRWSSNCTSTTAPITCVILPFTFAIYFVSGSLERLSARDDFNKLVGDDGLTGAVVLDRQLVDHLARVARCVVHGGHARALLRCRVFQQRR